MPTKNIDISYENKEDQIILGSLHTISTFLCAKGSFNHKPALKKVDPSIDFDKFEVLIKKIERSMIGFRRGILPIELNYKDEKQRETLKPVIKEIAKFMDKIVKSGQKAFFKEVDRIYEHIICSVPNAIEYLALDQELDNPEEVYIVNMGDLGVSGQYDYLYSLLSHLPQFPNLQAIFLYGCYLRNYDIQNIEFSKFQDLRLLDFSQCSLDYIPKSILKCKKLEDLSFYENKLNTLPDELGELKTLKKLNIKINSIPNQKIQEIQAKLPKCIISY